MPIQKTHVSKRPHPKPKPSERYTSEIAETQEALDRVAWLRGRCFGEELGLLPRGTTLIGREFGPLDTLKTSIHFETKAGDQSAAAARLLLPNPEVARAQGSRYGLSLEQLYRIVRGPGQEGIVAEVSRLCVLKQYHGTKVLLSLFARILRECKEWGVNYLLGATNLESSSLEDATIAYCLARYQGLLSPHWRAEPREPTAVVSSPPPSRYPLPQRLLALRGEFDRLRLPRTLSLLVKTVGARIIGEPMLDPYMGRFSIPLIVDLDALPPGRAELLLRAPLPSSASGGAR